VTGWELFLLGLGLAGSVFAVGLALMLVFMLYLAILGKRP
jgi:hypothetical protein